MIDANAIIEAVVAREGAYTNDPTDPGGETIWGITKQVARAFGFQGDMHAMPRATAVDIYRRRYWINPGYDRVAERSGAIAEALFDAGVNMGPATSTKYLQRALNALNRGASDYQDIGVDGGIGDITLHALDRYLAVRAAAGGVLVLLFMVIAQREVRYLELVEASPSQEKYAFGWEDRATNLLEKLRIAA